MHIEIISLFGAIIGASMSAAAGIFAWLKKRKLENIAMNSKPESADTSKSILENANHDIRDLQLQIKKLEIILREKNKKDLQQA